MMNCLYLLRGAADNTLSQPQFTNSSIWMFGREYKFDGGTSYHPLNLISQSPTGTGTQQNENIENNNSNSNSNNADINNLASILPTIQDQLFIQEFLEDFSSSVLWFTYRQGFQYIEGTNFESDRGWGCMLRSGQMLLSNLILHHVLGEQWRKSSPIKNSIVYTDIIKLFLDQPSSPFSIHNIALEGQKLGKNIGEWFAPSIISQAIKNLVSKNYKKCNISVFISEDGSLYIDKLLNISKEKNKTTKNNNNNNNNDNTTTTTSQEQELCNLEASFNTDIMLSEEEQEQQQKEEEKKEEHWEPLLILIPMRLGLEGLNSIYYSSLLEIFKFPQNLGVVGGKPRASLYFVAAQDDNLFYLDPHTVQNNVTESSLSPSSSTNTTTATTGEQQLPQQPQPQPFSNSPLSTFFCSGPKRTHVSEVDPSLVIAFFCNSYNDFMDFVERSKKMQTQFENPIFSIFDNEPDYKQERSLSMSTSCSSSLSDQSKNDDENNNSSNDNNDNDDSSNNNGDESVTSKDNNSIELQNITNSNQQDDSIDRDNEVGDEEEGEEESDDIDIEVDYHLM